MKKLTTEEYFNRPQPESKSADKQKINGLIHEKCDSFCSDSEGRFVFRFKEIEFMELVDELAQSHQVEMPSDDDIDREFPINLNPKSIYNVDCNAEALAKRSGAKWYKSQIK